MNIIALLQTCVFRARAYLPLALALLVLAVPAQAAELSYSATPLFWSTGAQPNVALMIDNSGSMSATDTGGSGNITSTCNNASIAQPMSRMQAAKEAACLVAQENASSMRIALYAFNGSSSGSQLQGFGSTATALKTSIQGLGASTNTPLSSAMSVIVNDYVGANSPIQYRCQKNYVVFFTDGEPNAGIDTTSPLAYPALATNQSSTWYGSTAVSGASSGAPGWDGFADPTYIGTGSTSVYPWLDELSQFAYDVDMKTNVSTTPAAACTTPAGKDCAGKSWQGTDDANPAAFSKQSVVTYTIGLGAEANNGLLRNTPLVNQIGLAPTNVNITNDTILLPAHGLEDGQFVHYYKIPAAPTAHVTKATADISADTLTGTIATVAAMSDGDQLTYSNGGGTALQYVTTPAKPATSCSDAGATMGLTSGATYYVAYKSNNTMKLGTTAALASACAADTNGSAAAIADCIDLTSVGGRGLTQGFARAAVTAAAPSFNWDYASYPAPPVIDVAANHERILINNHGLNTGDAVLYTCTTGGACNNSRAIGGLTTNNTYYVARVGTNDFRLATSVALAETCASFADNNAGVGANCINLGMPTQTSGIRTHIFSRAAAAAVNASFVSNGDETTTVPVHTGAGIERFTFGGNHNLNLSEKVTYTCSGAAAYVPPVIGTGTSFYARNVNSAAGTFQLYAANGLVVDITGAGNSNQTFSWTRSGQPTIGGLYAYETDAGPDNTPDPLFEPAAKGKYYVEYVDADSFKLRQCGNTADCTTEGAVVDLTSTGYGTLSAGPGRSSFASTAAELSSVLSEAFKSISANTLSFSTVATTSAEGSGPSRVYQATFATGDWSGDVVAYSLDANGDVSATSDWLASEHVPPQPPALTPRKILTWNPLTGVGVAISNISSLTPAQLTSLGPIADRQKVLDWVLGKDDVTLVGSRTRTNGVYGDIIGSSPHYVGQPNQNYDTALPATNTDGTDSGQSSYFAYTTTTRSPMVYVGSNDGMMHGMDADTGEEKVGFIPDAVYLDYLDVTDNGINDGEPTVQKFYELSRKDYGQIASLPHRYFVDGKITSGDAFFGGSWHTVVVGGLARGGRSIYALDVTDPSSFDETKVLWEFGSTSSSPAGEMGYSYSKPVIARLTSGKWAAIFGNGYDGSADLGRLFVVNLEDGTVIQRLTAPGSKGLSTVTLLKDTTGSVISVYAGDLAGNVWKFDLRDTNDGLWVNPSVPLFTAKDNNGNGQPITSAITLGPRPAGSSCANGYCTMLYFGTGSYFQAADKTYNPATAAPQFDSFYGIYDDGTAGTVTMTDLVAQTITETTINSTNYRQVSSNSVSYSSVRGWYIDLVVASNEQGERVVFEPVLAGKVIFFSTIIPASSDPCISGGSSWIMGVTAVDGTMRPVLFDTNGDGVFDSNDQPTAGIESPNGLFTGLVVRVVEVTTTLPSGETVTEYIGRLYSGQSGKDGSKSDIYDTTAKIDDDKKTPAPGSTTYQKGRMSWRQLQ